jgi:hypothetical protein
VTLTNAEKQARYRERHPGVDAKKVRVGLSLNAGNGAKIGRLARHRGYTITALVEVLAGRAGPLASECSRLTGREIRPLMAKTEDGRQGPVVSI